MHRPRLLGVITVGVVLLIFGMVYGVLFTFPSPDLPPETVALDQLHKTVSMGSLLGGVVLVEAALIAAIIRALGRRLVSFSRQAFAGLVVLIAGVIYASCFAFPLPNPPPQGMQWLGHLFVCITLVLTGLGLLTMSVSGRLMAGKQLRRSGR